MVAVLDNGKKDFYVGIYPPTGDYEFLDNQPAVDGVVLTKNTTKADLDLDKVFQYRGQVASYNKLPTKNRVIGDTYNVQDTGENYAWNGSSWDLLTGTEAVYWRNGALESQGSTLTIDSDKNPISNLILEDITDVTATKDEVNELHQGTAVKNDFIKLHSVTADANELNILDGATLSTTELNYVDGVTSAIQTQLNDKEPTITGAATTITSSNLTKNRAVISNNSGKIAVSDTTSTELGYVHGVTSAIQTQLNGKEATISDLETIRIGAGLGATALQNTATGTDSLSALGAQNSSFANTIAVGKMAAAGGGGISIGYSAQNSSGGGVTIGYSASGSTLGVTIGMESKGYGSNVIAIGNAAKIGSIGSNVDGAIMLGSGINNNAHTFRVGFGVFENGAYTTYEMLDSEGKVPGERMSKQSLSAPTTSTVGNIGQFYVDTTNEDGYMCVGIDDTDPENIVYTWKQITV